MRLPRDMRVAPPLPKAMRNQRRRRRHALLVNPFYPKDPHGSFLKHALTPSLALTTIAAATPPEWTVEFWDENLLRGAPPARPLPEVVGITVHLTMARRAYELADWFRRRGVVTVLGGPHVTALPGEAAPHADARVLGEGAQVWPRVLRDIERGELRPEYRGDFARPYRETPRREVLPRGAFLTPQSVIATRGCPNHCDFCYLSTEGLRMPYRARPVEHVVEELRRAGRPYAVFLDNNLSARPGYLRALCGALANLRVVWSAAVTVETAEDPSLVLAMARGGCVGVFIGFETVTGANLRDAGKRTPPPEEYARLVEVFHRHGIQVNGSFVFGFDHDGPDVFEKTVGWIESARLECATFQILTPYPGTPLFTRLESEGRILHRRWELYDTGHAVFRPKRMSPQDLEAGYARAYRDLFTLRSIWRRRPADPRAVLPYLASAVLYKKANPVWHRVIRHGLTEAAWSPLVRASRSGHLSRRRRLARSRTESLGRTPAFG